MPAIKRYPNRKLYNTETKKYITLDAIADLIRQGEDVHVFDHTSGEDLTTLTLTQIIFEQEKKKSGFLPRSVLTGLVQAGGDRLGSLRNALSAPLEMIRQVDEEIERRVKVLVNEGELKEEEGSRLIDKLLSQARQATKKITPSPKIVGNYLKKQGTPTHDDIAQLSAQLDALAVKLEQLNEESEANAE